MARQALSMRNGTTLGQTHTPLREAVIDAIRDRITSGQYRPGERLYEESVSQELGVSRNPVREAFHLLAAEGFVQIEPRRGARVATIDRDYAANVFDVRGALEALVSEQAAARATPETSDELRRIIAEGRRAIEDGELGDLPRLNTEFHHQLAAMADNAVLSSMLDQLTNLIQWMYAERLAERVIGSWSEHDAIVEAVARRDTVTARRLGRRHVLSARDAFLQFPSVGPTEVE